MIEKMAGKEIIIRPAKYSELDYIAQNTEGNITTEAFIKFLKCAYEMEPQYVLVATIDNEVVGHMVGISSYWRLLLKLVRRGGVLRLLTRGLVDRPPLDYRLLLGAQIGPLTVYPNYRQMGIAKLLSKRMAEVFQSKEIMGWTKETNTPIRIMAAGMFNEMGFSYNEFNCGRGWLRYEATRNAQLIEGDALVKDGKDLGC